ncbi:TSC22 domain family protein 1 [Heteronotia binoei]|uniref:TSC22 domain family protein 1 n=1 Tax=Heteronotia binoei TaxID=13085 RepID=UPI00292E6469|nr:TSC22 domain family protein 1 [Heteronotia binoei]
MHQQQPDSAAAAARKMAHPAMLPRAGGGGGGGGSGSLEEQQQPPPPQSLSLAAAPGPGAQLKKKSGFQITSVTPAAQISAASLSSNNSIAEDTESYDDLDESHTEDLSSSEILDVSLSRATDLGEPERSSSEETLNNFHEAETPGALSPNQPRLLNGALPPPTPPNAAPRKLPPARPPWRAASAPGLPSTAAGSSSSNPGPGQGGVGLGKGAPSGGPGNGPGALSGGSSSSPAAAPSRFRVVKLDSSSEPFKKGRWTCTEFYDKESLAAAAAAPDGGLAPHKALDALRQQQQAAAASEGGSERESPSGSSVGSSSLSTLSHYTESSLGSGEMAGAASSGAPDFAPALPASSLPQSLSQSQLHQEASYPPAAPATLAGLLPAVSLAGPQQQQRGGISAMLPPYAQAGPPVPPQQLPYGVGQGPPVPVQVAPGHVQAANPNSLPGPDYIPQQQQMLQAPAVGGAGTPAPSAPASSGLPSGPAHLAMAPTPPVACIQAAGASVPMVNAAQQAAMPPVVQQSLVANPMAPALMPQNAAPSQAMPSIPAGMIPPGSQAGASGLPQPLVIAAQPSLLPAQSQLQSGEALVPGMAGQQVPAVSPGPPVGAVPVSGHCAANVPPPPASLAPLKNVVPSSAMQNENLAQKLPQSSLTSTSINLPMPPNVPPLNSAPFSAQSLAHSSVSRGGEARRSTDPLLVGIAQPLGPESGAGVPSALLDGASSMAASLFPLKGLPLTAQLMDGEDDGSSGASVVAIDNKIEQAMDLVKSHLMYAVREEVEVLKEQIKELIEKNNQLEQENSLLKTLASPEQLAQLQAQLQTSSSPASSQPQGTGQPPPQPALPGSGPSA